MRVLHFKTTMRAEEGGVVKAVLDLCGEAAKAGIDVVLATVDPSGVPESWGRGHADTPSVRKLPGSVSRSGRLDKAQLTAVRELVRGCDAVHLHSMWTTANPQIAKICAEEKVPYIISVHGMLDDWCMSQRRLKKQIYLHTLARGFLRDASIIHCTAEAEFAQAKAWFDPSKGRIVPLPMDLEPFRDLPDTQVALAAFPQIDPTRPAILFLSRIHYKKAPEKLVRAIASLKRDGVETQLLIAGTGETDYVAQIQSLVRSVGIEQETHFLGFVSGRTKVSLMRYADVFALPTSQENFGFVFFESLAAGTPLVTTKGVDTWPELEASGGAVIVDAEPEAFARAIRDLLSDPQSTAARGEAGRKWAMRFCDPLTTRNTYLKMYQECAGKTE